MTKYAEQILEAEKCNQWFLLLHNQNANWNPSVLESHIQWLNAHLVEHEMVAGMGETHAQGNLYHVKFDSHSDSRLASYSAQFEDSEGVSLQPDQYQMVEWSYQGWIESGGRTEFFAWLEKQTIWY